jgi:YggT family protein
MNRLHANRVRTLTARRPGLAEALLVTDILYNVIMVILRLMTYALILSAIVSTLMAFNVLDSRNRFVWSLADFLYRVTEPVLRPIRRVLPTMGNIDLSPWIALLLIQLVVAPLVTALYAGIRYGVWQPLF